MARRHLSFIPISALTAIVAALYLFVKPSLFYEPSWLG
jgi:branched-subunit amino acid transport protein